MSYFPDVFCYDPALTSPPEKYLKMLDRVATRHVRSQKDVDKWLSARQFRADYVPLLKWNRRRLSREN